MLLDALLLQAGYNAALVAVGAALLGIAAGSSGAFLFLRKRALVSDATAHATLPGVCLAFIVMVALGSDGRNLIGLLAGSAVTALVGLLIVEWMTRRTRLTEDSAIGAVLSVFFGFGVVLLTIIQTMSSGKQAGLEGFLLGSTAGMLFEEAIIIAVGGTLCMALVYLLRRPMTLVAFDSEFAASTGINVQRIDILMMGVVMGVTVIGLKIVGLILIVAMLVIPPVTARFWSDRTDDVLWVAGGVGGVSGYVGAAISASAPALPTGPIIVLVAFALFVLSLFLSPKRGVLAAVLRNRAFQTQVHRRQGLLALAHGEPVLEPLTLRVLKRASLIRADGVPTPEGRAQAAKSLLDEQRWNIARARYTDEAVTSRYDGLTPIETVLTADELVEIDRELGPKGAIAGASA